MLAAHAARQWLARNAAGVKRTRARFHDADPFACTSLVMCLPSLENVQLSLLGPLLPDDLGSLLEALAWCPRLRELHLCVDGHL